MTNCANCHGLGRVPDYTRAKDDRGNYINPPQTTCWICGGTGISREPDPPRSSPSKSGSSGTQKHNSPPSPSSGKKSGSSGCGCLIIVIIGFLLIGILNSDKIPTQKDSVSEIKSRTQSPGAFERKRSYALKPSPSPSVNNHQESRPLTFPSPTPPPSLGKSRQHSQTLQNLPAPLLFPNSDELDIYVNKNKPKEVTVFFTKHLNLEYTHCVYDSQSNRLMIQTSHGTWYFLGVLIRDLLHPYFLTANNLKFARTAINPANGEREVAEEVVVPLYQSGKYVLGLTVAEIDSFSFEGKTFRYGIKIHGAIRQMPGYEAGLREGDIIYQIDNTKMNDKAAFFDYLKATQGAPVKVHFLRNGNLYSVWSRPINHIYSY